MTQNMSVKNEIADVYKRLGLGQDVEPEVVVVGQDGPCLKDNPEWTGKGTAGFGCPDCGFDHCQDEPCVNTQDDTPGMKRDQYGNLIVPDIELDDDTAEEIKNDTKRCVGTQDDDDDCAAVLPPFDPHYESPDWARVLEYALDDPDENGALLFGPRGTGKTSGVQQTCHRMDKKLVVMQCARGKGLEALVGGWRAENGTTYWQDGPLVTALLNGCVLVCEEANMMPEGLWSDLNTLTDGSGHKLNLPDGRRLAASDGFRVVLCYNPSYAGCKGINEALKDRLMPIYTEYLPAETEAKILMNRVDGLPNYVAESMCKIAAGVRATAKQHRFDMSIRCLMRWARMTIKLGMTWEESWKMAVLNLVGDPETYTVQRDVIDNIGRMEWEAWAEL